jgi:hypothetical protein
LRRVEDHGNGQFAGFKRFLRDASEQIQTDISRLSLILAHLPGESKTPENYLLPKAGAYKEPPYTCSTSKWARLARRALTETDRTTFHRQQPSIQNHFFFIRDWKRILVDGDLAAWVSYFADKARKDFGVDSEKVKF